MAQPDPVPRSSSATDIAATQPAEKKRIFICDRCGFEMREKNCKVVCPNCGNQFDCSDLNLYFD